MFVSRIYDDVGDDYVPDSAKAEKTNKDDKAKKRNYFGEKDKVRHDRFICFCCLF